MPVKHRVLVESLGPCRADIILAQSFNHARPDEARLHGNAADGEDRSWQHDVPPAVEEDLQTIAESDADGVCSEDRHRSIVDQADGQQIGDPETGQRDEDKGQDARDHIRRSPRMPRTVNAEQKAETQGQRQRPEIESEGGGEALGDFRQHRPFVLDAAQLAGEEVTHDEPVLLM